MGSFLAVWLVRQGVHPTQADEPTIMYHHAFREVFQSPTFALVLTGVFVIVCQLKINVTNAYAGSIAWSNFFSRLTHSHPGRVVWLVFNVVLALILMEIGIFRAIESILVIYANFAAGWIGALTADLVVNKPLGYSPKYIEFKRAHLYDINPVGVGALAISVLLSSLAFMGLFGQHAEILSPFVALFVAFIAAPIIAIATRGKYYLARPATGLPGNSAELRMQHLRERVRARRHRHVPGLLRSHLLAVLHAGGALPRPVQDEQPLQRAARRIHPPRVAGACGRVAEYPRRPFRRPAAAVQPRHRLPAGAHLPAVQPCRAGATRGHRAPRCGWCTSPCCSSPA